MIAMQRAAFPKEEHFLRIDILVFFPTLKHSAQQKSIVVFTYILKKIHATTPFGRSPASVIIWVPIPVQKHQSFRKRYKKMLKGNSVRITLSEKRNGISMSLIVFPDFEVTYQNRSAGLIYIENPGLLYR